MNIKYPKTLDELALHIKQKSPSLYVSSQTSTVIPYQFIEKYLTLSQDIIYLSELPKKMEIKDNATLFIEGPVSWQDACAFCESKGYSIKTSPTEQLASVLAGVATSCTGERAFGFGPFRNHVLELSYFDFNGEFKKLTSTKSLEKFPKLSDYQEQYVPYKQFKNAPFPRLEKETDMLIGTEGQLGIIVNALIEITPSQNLKYFFIPLPYWVEDTHSHLEIYSLLQSFRGKIISAEFVDKHSVEFLAEEIRPKHSGDLLFIELNETFFEDIFENFFMQIQSINIDDICEISHSKYSLMRTSIPQAVQEYNASHKLIKKGTDVQASPEDFSKLLELYQDFTKHNVKFTLFGHFGDAHLHFNFLPNESQKESVDHLLENFYKEIASTLTVSPFAEHGIGLIKKNYIKHYYNQTHLDVFKTLKEKHDPQGIFFPEGFMSFFS